MSDKMKLLFFTVLLSHYAVGQMPFEQFYESGNTSVIGQKLNEKLHGRIFMFFDDTTKTISQVAEYQNGILEGVLITYYPSGEIKSFTNYQNGRRNGAVIGYYESGKIREISNHINGASEGPWIQYYENGSIRTCGFMSGNKEQGPELIFYIDGKLKKRISYNKLGEYHGLTQEYDNNGTLIFSKEFINGEELKK